MPPVRDTQRIAKLLARAGIASRREVERMIADGRVAIEGRVVDTPATLLESLHGVTVDGKPVRAPAPARLYGFHKPAGVLTTERDPRGRPTIYDVLPKGLPRLVPVGRLDMNTEGLLLLTTDGELKRQLELPANGVERTYRARTFGEVSQDQLEQLIHGVEIEGIRYGAIDANLERRTGRNQWIEVKLKEGKNREVRRVLEHLGLQVSRLIRTAYGPFHLAGLAPGAVEEVRQHDLVAFRKWLAAPQGPMPTLSGPKRPRREASEETKPVRAPAARAARPADRDGAKPGRGADRRSGEAQRGDRPRRPGGAPEQGKAASPPAPRGRGRTGKAAAPRGEGPGRAGPAAKPGGGRGRPGRRR